MVRRNLLREELDRRIVRAALIASAIALCLGWTARKLETRQAVAQQPPVAEAVAAEVAND